MAQVRRAYAQPSERRQDSTRTDAARARAIELRSARTLKRDTVGGAR